MQNTNNINYIAAIFYTDEDQRIIAEKSKKDLNDSGRFPKEVVTRILPASIFYKAENYHENFYRTNPIEYKKDRSISGRDGFIQKYWGDDYYSIYDE